MLKFYGIGSAFNTKLGNNGAFWISQDGQTLFLIDCGSVTFDRLKAYGLLDGVKRLYVLLTHFHPDHIGSLGDLIFYSYYAMGEMLVPKLTVLTPDAVGVYNVLSGVGVEEGTYGIQELAIRAHNHVEVEGLGTVRIQPVEVSHVKNLTCFAYKINRAVEGKETTIYYSGDCNEIPWDILEDLKSGKIERFYQDTSGADYEGNVHLSFRKLCELIPKEYRNKVYCMHLDQKFSESEAKKEGFNVVEIL